MKFTGRCGTLKKLMAEEHDQVENITEVNSS